MSVEVRTAVPADIPALLHLYEQLAEGYGHHPASAERARSAVEEMAHQSGRALLVAVDEGRVVGTVDLMIISPNLTHEGRPCAIVEHVVVDRGARRHGAGRKLMDEALRRAREAGCYRVQLLSDRRRTEAHAFYRAVGFEASAVGFRRPLP